MSRDSEIKAGWLSFWIVTQEQALRLLSNIRQHQRSRDLVRKPGSIRCLLRSSRGRHMSWNSNSEPMTNVSSKSVINPDANAEEAHEIDCGR